MLATKKFSKQIQNNNGLAVIEMIPILIIIVLIVNFSIGFFGVVHTGNLNTIAARNYLFETLRNRSNIDYHRANDINYVASGSKYGGIVSETQSGVDEWQATARRLSWVSFFGGKSKKDDVELNREPASVDQQSVHSKKILGLDDGGARNESIEVYNVWIRSIYGICLNSKCGDSN